MHVEMPYLARLLGSNETVTLGTGVLIVLYRESIQKPPFCISILTRMHVDMSNLASLLGSNETVALGTGVLVIL